MSLLRKEIVKPDGFTGKFYRIFKKEMRQILHKVKKKEGILANLFNEATQTRQTLQKMTDEYSSYRSMYL